MSDDIEFKVADALIEAQQKRIAELEAEVAEHKHRAIRNAEAANGQFEAGVQAEREACAKIADDYRDQFDHVSTEWWAASAVGDMIRARGGE